MATHSPVTATFTSIDILVAHQFGRNKYQEAILKLIEKGQERLELDIDDLRSYDSRLARRCGAAQLCMVGKCTHSTIMLLRVITQPVDYLPQLHRALGDVVNNFDKNFAKDHPVCISGTSASHNGKR